MKTYEQRQADRQCMAAQEWNRLASHIRWGDEGLSQSSVGLVCELVGDMSTGGQQFTWNNAPGLVETHRHLWRFADGSWLTFDSTARGPEWAGVLAGLVVHPPDPRTFWERTGTDGAAWDDNEHTARIYDTQAEALADTERGGEVRQLTRWQADDLEYEIDDVK